MDKALISYFLPECILDYFTVIKVQKIRSKTGKDIDIYIDMEEKNELRSVSNPSDYESKGFFTAKTIQDFPIRGKAVYLVIKRRRWRDKEDKHKTVSNDYTIFAEGVKLTQELSDFLKSTGRDPRRYD
jgi:hypothetical protein